MPWLEDERTGERIPLMDRHLMGRSSRCDQVVADARVSGEHALLTWSGARWQLRDLNSRNGTWLDGHRLEAAEVLPVTSGQSVRMGSSEVGFTLVDAGPPEPMGCHQGTPRTGEDGVLTLPDDDGVLILRQARSWIARFPDGDRPVQSGDTLNIDGQCWTLRLPTPLAATAEAQDEATSFSLVLEVSLDEEHTRVTAIWGQRTFHLRPRTHHYVLVTLARLHQRDEAQGVDPEERGWVHQEDLARMLRVTDAYVNLAVHRTRRQVLAAGLPGGEAVIERRSRTRQLRIGVPFTLS